MTDRPAQSADWHAFRAENLTSLARSTSMRGWLKRGQRRDLLAQAQVHATLATVPDAAAAVDPQVLTALANSEDQRTAAQARVRLLENELEQVQRTLRNYGRDVGDVLDVAEAVEALLGDRSMAEPGPHPAQRMSQPKGYLCPACSHGTAVHREHGCDVTSCECVAPFGRIMPGDPNPSSPSA